MFVVIIVELNIEGKSIKKPIIDLKIIQDGDNIIIAKEPLRDKCKDCLTEPSIVQEIQELNKFFQIILEKITLY